MDKKIKLSGIQEVLSEIFEFWTVCHKSQVASTRNLGTLSTRTSTRELRTSYVVKDRRHFIVCVEQTFDDVVLRWILRVFPLFVRIFDKEVVSHYFYDVIVFPLQL